MKLRAFRAGSLLVLLVFRGLIAAAQIDPAEASATNSFYIPGTPTYSIFDSALDSVQFTLNKTLQGDPQGHLVSISSFVDPEGRAMGWHDFGNPRGAWMGRQCRRRGLGDLSTRAS